MLQLKSGNGSDGPGEPLAVGLAIAVQSFAVDREHPIAEAYAVGRHFGRERGDHHASLQSDFVDTCRIDRKLGILICGLFGHREYEQADEGCRDARDEHDLVGAQDPARQRRDAFGQSKCPAIGHASPPLRQVAGRDTAPPVGDRQAGRATWLRARAQVSGSMTFQNQFDIVEISGR